MTVRPHALTVIAWRADDSDAGQQLSSLSLFLEIPQPGRLYDGYRGSLNNRDLRSTPFSAFQSMLGESARREGTLVPKRNRKRSP
jgi:hypothetical protein